MALKPFPRAPPAPTAADMMTFLAWLRERGAGTVAEDRVEVTSASLTSFVDGTPHYLAAKAVGQTVVAYQWGTGEFIHSFDEYRLFYDARSGERSRLPPALRESDAACWLSSVPASTQMI
jgi:hypothetical protein